MGNADKGLDSGTGPAVEGNWRLEVESELDIEALAYVRHQDGFLTSMHAVAPERGGIHRVATFNPASNARQQSRLRLVNPADQPASVTIRGVDDGGASPGTEVALTVPALSAATLTAPQQESGGEGLTGALGDGAGKWRLHVEADRSVLVMSLMQSPTGHLTNLSGRALP